MTAPETPKGTREPLFRKDGDLASASVVLGVFALATLLLCPLISIPLAATGLHCGIRAQNTERHHLALLGTVVNIVALLATGLLLIVLLAMI